MYSLISAVLLEKINFSNLSKGKIYSLAQSRLSDILKHVLNHSSFYKSYYAAHDISGYDTNSISIKNLPTVNKSILMENFNAVANDENLSSTHIKQYFSKEFNYKGWYSGKYKLIKTSGSSGNPGIFVYGKDDWNRLRAMLMNRSGNANALFRKKLKLASIIDTTDFHAGITLAGSAPEFLYDVYPIQINLPIKDIICNLNKIKPDILSGYSSGIHSLALEKIKGNLHIHPSQIGCSGELLTNEMRETIYQAFTIYPINLYAASESLCIGISCKEGNIHLNEDWNIVEPLSDGYYLTNLYNYTFPLIRYKMEDRLILSEAQCKCGSPFKHIEKLEGRTEDVIKFNVGDDTEILFHSIITKLSIQGIKRFQLIQHENEKLMLKICPEEHIDRVGLRKRTSSIMSEILNIKGLGDTVKFTVRFVDSIPNDPYTGKYQHIISYERFKKMEVEEKYMNHLISIFHECLKYDPDE